MFEFPTGKVECCPENSDCEDICKEFVYPPSYQIHDIVKKAPPLNQRLLQLRQYILSVSELNKVLSNT
jgi:hypothetical protein